MRMSTDLILQPASSQQARRGSVHPWEWEPHSVPLGFSGRRFLRNFEDLGAQQISKLFLEMGRLGSIDILRILKIWESRQVL